MGAYSDLLLGPESEVSAEPVVDPVQRPDPIQRPGPVQPRGQPSPQRGAPRTAPAPMPAAAAPQPDQQGDPVQEWLSIMRKHEVPPSAVPDLVEHYYGMDRTGKGGGNIPPALEADILAYQRRFPGQGKVTQDAARPDPAPSAGRQPSAAPMPSPSQALPERGVGNSADAAPAPPQAPAAGQTPRRYSDQLLGAATPAATATPRELTYDPERTLGFVDQAKGSFAATDAQWKYLAAKALYPNERPEIAAQRFGRSKDGRMYHRGDDGKFYEVQPPKGLARLANVGEGVGPALPAVAGGVAGIAAMPWTGGAGSIPAAGIGAYAGDVVRQYIGNQLLPEDQQGYSVGGAIKEGIVGGVGQGIGVGVNRFVGRFAAPDIGNYDRQATQNLLTQAQQHGVRLTPAEATNLSSVIGEQKRLTASPRAANEMNAFYAERNQEAGNAFNRLLDTVGRPRDAGELGRQASGIATDALTAAQTARTRAVDPLYRTADRVIDVVNPGTVSQFIADGLPHAKGSDRAAFRFVRDQLQRLDAEGRPTGIDTTFRGMNGAKMAIDAILQNEDLAAKQGIDRTAHATLQRARDLIVQAIESHPAAAGQNGQPGIYEAARNVYAHASQHIVDPIQEVLAPLLRANPANSSIVRTASAVLDPSSRTPQLVTQARRLIEQRDPEVWGSLVRQFMHEHAYAALQENAKGSVTNVGGNIAKRIGNDKIEGVLRAALPQQQFEAYQSLMNVLRATGRAVDTNSDTAFKQQAIQQAKDRSRGIVGKVLANMNPLQWPKDAAAFLADRNYERQAATIARIFTQGDQQAIEALRQLRQADPGDVRRIMIIGHLVSKTGEYGATKALE